MIKKVTFKDVEWWLGTNNPETEAIEALVDLANGDYKPDQFRQEVKDLGRDK